MWQLQVSRYLALVFALVLAVVEALLNMALPKWQYAPLWIIDYVIVFALLGSFWVTRRRAHTPLLMASWALGAGVFYMALFIGLDPALKLGLADQPLLMSLIGLALCVQLLGLALATAAHWRSVSARDPSPGH